VLPLPGIGIAPKRWGFWSGRQWQLIYSDFTYVISWHTSCHTVPKAKESRGGR
jgi:hypothetical protein